MALCSLIFSIQSIQALYYLFIASARQSKKKKNGLLCYRLSGSYLFGRKRMYSKEILMDSAGISNRTLYTFITGLICEMFVNYVAYCRRFPCHFFCTYIPPKHKTHGHLQKKNSQFQAAHLSQGMY